ncbi:hypothetical protein OHA33_44855 (plasmid) [Streptomyces sp. NBC_00562]|nr:hypothetical protein [Streptomyces sp. NBC_00562]WUC25841.1 hypothetical protein OHA33_44855 [Streptomyces sp. NBC_00562]
MEFPIEVALARPVPVLPHGPGWWYEPGSGPEMSHSQGSALT